MRHGTCAKLFECNKVLEEWLGEAFQASARKGFRFLVSYIGSAFLHVHELYGARIKLVLSSWNSVQKTEAHVEPHVEEKASEEASEKEKVSEAVEEKEEKVEKVENEMKEMKIPSNFNEMLLFNASVMGYGASEWMKIVLVQFDDMVRSVANFTRLQEDGHEA